MKRQIPILLLGLVVTAFNIGTKPLSHVEKLHLNGRVKSILEIVTLIRPDSATQIINTVSKSFNNQGYILEERELHNHMLFSKKVYKYSENNVQTSYTDLNADGSVYYKVSFQTDEKGYLITENYDRSEQKYYNESRQKIDVEYEKAYLNLYTQIQYKNDFKGFKLEETYLKPNGDLSHKYTYKYDYKYNLFELKYYNSSGNAVKRIKYRYNSNGDVEESIAFISNRLAVISKYTYEYDDFGNWISRYETKKVEDNIFTTDINKSNILTQRIIEYYH